MSKLYVNEIKPKTTGNIVNGLSNVLEVLPMNCDGGSYTVPSGTYTAPNITALQTLTTTFSDITSSVITYTPPEGTIAVIYQHEMKISTGNDTRLICSFKFFVDGTEVVYARAGADGNYFGGRLPFSWVIPVGGTADSNTGRVASWTSGKELKMQGNTYSASYDTRLHVNQEWNNSGTDVFNAPTLTITAIGGKYNG
ncbi:MAG: hypothetical protein CMF51_02400 [Legionellales bacterium]|nr:hypothetical protein [Legionellales bacterium]|tara:strand:+ start:2668 stop:3258 length:591 start_codon:yes stop_codon:yes gene_type:complete